MPDYAIPRPGYNGEPFGDWLTMQLQKNPHYPLPQGWKNDNGRAVRDTHSFLDDAIMYGAPAAGFGIAGGIGASSAFGGGGGAAASALPGTSATTGALGGASTAAAGGGGIMGAIAPYLKAGSQILPMVGALTSRGGNQTPMDGELQRLLQMQNSRMQQSQPLYDAILKLAMGLLPRGVQTPTAAPQPGMTRPRY
jgi:hypothetical protein